MARTKSNEFTIKSLEEADWILKEMCELESKIEAIDNEADEEIARIKKTASEEGKPLRDRYKSCVKAMEAYARYARGEIFDGKKSLTRAFGTFGFRKAPDSISVTKETAGLLQKCGLEQYVRTKIEPDKEAMLSLDDETLATVGAARKQKEDFFVETKREQVNQDQLRQSA
ncbi:MAG: host-nuclease inhibitor Gam family protein [Treponema sp.]|jgi:phage host-nuclease inhibitor protein Gam|nr:host-nuclease inhibitor Gam family protein [Treponema sp.]